MLLDPIPYLAPDAASRKIVGGHYSEFVPATIVVLWQPPISYTGWVGVEGWEFLGLQ